MGRAQRIALAAAAAAAAAHVLLHLKRSGYNREVDSFACEDTREDEFHDADSKSMGQTIWTTNLKNITALLTQGCMLQTHIQSNFLNCKALNQQLEVLKASKSDELLTHTQELKEAEEVLEELRAKLTQARTDLEVAETEAEGQDGHTNTGRLQQVQRVNGKSLTELSMKVKQLHEDLIMEENRLQIHEQRNTVEKMQLELKTLNFRITEEASSSKLATLQKMADTVQEEAVKLHQELEVWRKLDDMEDAAEDVFVHAAALTTVITEGAEECFKKASEYTGFNP